MNNTATRCTDDLLHQLAVLEHTILDEKTTVFEWDVSVLVVVAQNVQARWKSHGDDLLSCPSRAWLEDSRVRQKAVPSWNPHHGVHDFLLRKHGVTSGELVNASHGVLDETHERAVLLRRHNVERNSTEVHDLSTGLVRLRNVQVHLVTVEIGVVGCGDGKVHAEGRVWHDSHSVTHHGFLVKRGLTVEDDVVAIYDVTLHFPAELKLNVLRSLVVPEVNTLTGVADDVLGTWMLVRSIANQLVHLVDVVVVHCLRERQGSRNRSGNTHLVERQVGVTCDDSTCGEVDTLAHQVTTKTTLLRL